MYKVNLIWRHMCLSKGTLYEFAIFSEKLCARSSAVQTF